MALFSVAKKILKKVAEKSAKKAKDARKAGKQKKAAATKKQQDANVKSSRTKKPAERSKAEVKARNARAKQLRQKREAKRIAKNQKIAAGTKGFKGKMAGILGTGGLGGLIGSMFGGGGGDEPDALAPGGLADDQSRATPAQMLEDKPIDLSWMPMAMAVSIPQLETNEQISGAAEASIIVTEDIMLDEEGGYPFIEAGTMLPTRVAEIGKLFQIVDGLRNQVGDLNKQLVITNSSLRLVKDALKEAIAQNAATKRANERRRDEEDAEGGRIKGAALAVGSLGAAYVTTKAMGLFARASNIAMMGAMALFADDVAAIFTDDEPEPEIEEDTGALDPDKDYADSLETAQEGQYLTPDQMRELGLDAPENDGVTEDDDVQEETDINVEEEAGLLEQTFDAMTEGPTGAVTEAAEVVGLGAMAATGVSMAAGALGATGVAAAGAATAAVLAPVALAAGVLATGAIAGKLIADNTEIDEAIGEAIFGGGDVNIEDVEATSEEEMAEKYSGMNDVEKFGDLLGEGLFDTAESESDIKAAFKDMRYREYMDLGERYEEEHGTPLSEAIFSAVGMEGLDDILDMITANDVADKMAEERDGTPDPVEEKITPPETITVTDSAGFEFEIPAEESSKMEVPIPEELPEQTIHPQAVQIKADLRAGKISSVEALKRLRDLDYDPQKLIKDGIGKKDLRLPEIGEVIPVSELLEKVPAEVREEVSDVINEKIESPINDTISGINDKVDSVVDETIDEVMKTTILPVVKNLSNQKERPIPAGTQLKSSLESGGPSYASIDPFLSIAKNQT